MRERDREDGERCRGDWRKWSNLLIEIV
jgi:hypothetical protein